MASSPPVNTYTTTTNTRRNLRRIPGQPSLTRAINSQAMRPDPVTTTPHPEPIAMNQSFPKFGHGVVPPSVFGERPTTAGATTGLGHPTRQPQHRNVLQKRRPSEPSAVARSCSFGRIMNHCLCFRTHSVSKTSPLFVGEPYDPVHLFNGPEGQHMGMIRHDIFIGQVPRIIVTRAPNVDQHVPNAPRAAFKSRTNSMSSGCSIRGPHLTVGDAWSPGNMEHPRVTFLAPLVPSSSPRRVQAGVPLAAHLRELYSEEEALERVAIAHQMAAANNRALARHFEYLEARAQESAVSSEKPAELDGNFSAPIFMCPVHGLLAQTDSLPQGDHDPTELPATPPSERQELEATSARTELPGQSAFLLPQLQPFRATMDFGDVLDAVRGELFELDAPHNSTETPISDQAMGKTEVSSAQRFHYGNSRIEAVPRTFRVRLPTSEVEEASELLAALKLNTWDWCSTPDLQPQDPRTM